MDENFDMIESNEENECFRDFDLVKEITKIIPATGWYAQYANEHTGETDQYPLVCWAVVKIDGKDTVVGMDAASGECVEFCAGDAGFIGYVFLGNQSFD